MKEIIINCKEDNNFEYGRSITRSCGDSFSLDKDNVFYVETPIYNDEIVGQYYTICPKCGYIVLLNKEELPKDFKIEAEEKNHIPFKHQENDLISRLINIRSRRKIRVRTFF